jgi:hypothetical protein
MYYYSLQIKMGLKAKNKTKNLEFIGAFEVYPSRFLSSA